MVHFVSDNVLRTRTMLKRSTNSVSSSLHNKRRDWSRDCLSPNRYNTNRTFFLSTHDGTFMLLGMLWPEITFGTLRETRSYSTDKKNTYDPLPYVEVDSLLRSFGFVFGVLSRVHNSSGRNKSRSRRSKWAFGEKSAISSSKNPKLACNLSWMHGKGSRIIAEKADFVLHKISFGAKKCNHAQMFVTKS